VRERERETKKLGAKDTLDESETLRADEAARIAAQLGSAQLYGLGIWFFGRGDVATRWIYRRFNLSSAVLTAGTPRD